jgi:plasmid stabilization system protein ParE
MPIRVVSFNRLAIKDLREARDWYAKRSIDVAAQFVDEVDAAVKRIVDAPDSWSVVSGKYRRLSLDKFPHSLIYYERAEYDIRIVAVAHPSRRPGYWRRRENWLIHGRHGNLHATS